MTTTWVICLGNAEACGCERLGCAERQGASIIAQKSGGRKDFGMSLIAVVLLIEIEGHDLTPSKFRAMLVMATECLSKTRAEFAARDAARSRVLQILFLLVVESTKL